MKGSHLEFLKEKNLCWEKDKFSVLGITFSVELNKMIELNYQDKIKSIKTLISQWSKRVLTPYGKIVVIKTLALSKMNHLFMVLLNQPEQII